MDISSGVAANVLSAHSAILTEVMRQQVEQLAEIQKMIAQTAELLSQTQVVSNPNLGNSINFYA